MNKDQAVIDSVCQYWRELPPNLLQLEELRIRFVNKTFNKEKTLWLKALRKGLGVSSQAMAEKLGTSRGGILDFENREASRQITLKSLEAWAEALDCNLVYGFVPKTQPTFLHLLVAKCLPFLDDAFLRSFKKSPPDKARAIYSRMMKFLGHKTGWSQAWGYKKALKRRNFHWQSARFRLRD